MVVSPAMGGIIPAMRRRARCGRKAVFVEREDGEFQLRRGFEISTRRARCVMVEDIVTTGLSSRECIAAIRKHPGELLGGAACIVDRSNGKADIGVPLVSLIRLDVPAHPRRPAAARAGGDPRDRAEQPGGHARRRRR